MAPEQGQFLQIMYRPHLIKRNNPIDYYGITNTELMGYYINNNNEMIVSKDENCYVKVRLIYNDGG